MEDNVLDPEKLWIGNRCYRVNLLNENRKENVKINYEEESIEIEFDDEECLEIEAIGDKLQLKIHVPQQFYGSIIGTKGTTKKRLEQGKIFD
jgi:rRNA processing protein Krr1/Pno1